MNKDCHLCEKKIDFGNNSFVVFIDKKEDPQTGKKKRVILNRTCHWCGELCPSEEVEFRLAHEGECEKCPDGKCKCTKKMKRYWTCNDCINSGDMCCGLDSDD